MPVKKGKVELNVNHVVYPTTAAFWECKKPIRIMMGPLNGGKTRSMFMTLILYATRDMPRSIIDGKRRSRFIITRPTLSSTIETVAKDIEEAFPPELLGSKTRFIKKPPKYELKTDDLDIEIHFFGIRTMDDIHRIRSFNATGVFVNELKFMDEAPFSELIGRTGRFPTSNTLARDKDGNEQSLKQFVIADTNAMAKDHWIYRWVHIEKEKYEPILGFFKQPSGESEFAENLEHMPVDFYKNMKITAHKDHYAVVVLNQFGRELDGNAVYASSWDEERHVFRDEKNVKIEYDETIYIGLDFGLTPCAVFSVKRGKKWVVFAELLTPFEAQQSIQTFCIKFYEMCNDYGILDNKKVITGDPAGLIKDQSFNTSYQLLAKPLLYKGRYRSIIASPCTLKSNNIMSRLEAVKLVLEKETTDSENKEIEQNGFSIHSSCKILIAGFNGGYRYGRRNPDTPGDDPKPNKNDYSHIHDALQYLLLGSGMDAELHTGDIPYSQMKKMFKSKKYKEYKICY